MTRIAVPWQVRLRVLRRAALQCVLCKSEGELEIDHIIPVSRGGTNDESNLQVLCRACNAAKGPRGVAGSAATMASQELQDWRRAAKLSQPGLAALLGVHWMTVSKWERGERAIPPYLWLALRALQEQSSGASDAR